MPVCAICSNIFPNRMIVDGVEKRTHRRKYCVDCSPIGSNNQRTKGNRAPESKEAWSARQNKRRRLLKEKCIDYLGGKCVVCDYSRCSSALEFHHRDPSLKSFPLDSASIASKSWDRIIEELNKCVLVCANHHREIECGLIECP